MKIKRFLSLSLALILSVSAVFFATSCADIAAKLPIVCGESNMNEVCGVATYGVDYYSLGLLAGDMAADILIDDANPATTPVKIDNAPALIVNEAVANEIGFTIPQSILDRAASPADNSVTRVQSAFVTADGDYKIGILQLVQHTALDAANRGFLDQLSVRLDGAGKTAVIDNKNASGDESNNTTIANNFVSGNVDLIYTIATSSSQAAVSAVEGTSIPVLFNAVTDPVSAGLVLDMNTPGKNVTGVSDINPVGAQLDLIAELVGKQNPKIGFLYTSSETNSVYQVRTLGIPHCNEKGYTYVERGIADINDLESAMIYLSQQGIDAIYVPTDNTLANGAAIIHTKNTGN